MKKTILCALFCSKKVLLLSLFAAVGASHASAETQDQIDQIIKRLSGMQLVHGQFAQQKKLQGLAYPLKAQGQFIFWQQQGLYLATEKPFFNAFTITGDVLINWKQDGSGSVAQEQAAIIQREVNKTLLAFFRADIALIQQRFIADWAFEQNSWQLELTPKLDFMKKNMRSVVLYGDSFLQKLTVIAANGDETIIQFSAQQQRTAPTAAECRWFYLQAQEPCAKFVAAE